MPRPGVNFRPAVEALEAREVPASLEWTNAIGNGDFDTLGNWRDRYTHAAVLLAPTSGDDLFFDGGVSSGNCINMHAATATGGNGGPIGGGSRTAPHAGRRQLQLSPPD